MKNRWDKSNIAISAIWYERYLECSRTYGTSEFPKSVWRFYHSLLDLDNDKLNIKSQVKEFINNVWNPYIKKIVRENTKITTDPDVVHSEYRITEAQHIDELLDFITQTIQNSGIGWHTQDDMQSFNITQE